MMRLPDQQDQQQEERAANLPPAQSQVSRYLGAVLIVGLLAALTVFSGLVALAVVLALIFMIFLHELGHFLTARWTGMKVSGFFLGFGPRLWSVRRGETEYGVRALPLGAYVRILGMSNLEDIPPQEEHRTYRAKPYRSRLLVAVAGSAMHFLLAIGVLWFAFSAIGYFSITSSAEERSREWNIAEVIPGTPADAAGFQAGDKIIGANGNPLDSRIEAVDFISQRPGGNADFEVERGGQIVSVRSDIGTNAAGDGRLGIRIRQLDPPTSGFFEGLGQSFSEFGELARLSTVGLWEVFSPNGLQNLWDDVFGDGPEPIIGEGTGEESRAVSIYGVSRIAIDLGDTGAWGDMLFLFAAINIFVGLFNLVPLPPLDGGHVAVATYEKLRSRKGRSYRIDAAKLVPLQYLVLLLLIAVFAAVLYLDVANPIS